MAADLSSLGALNGYARAGQAQTARPDATKDAAGAKDKPEAVQEAAKAFAAAFEEADAAVAAAAKGEGSAQAVVEAMAQAEMAMETAVTLRDKVVEAYQEILRMPV